METTPVEIRRVENREVHISWADGHKSVFTNKYLRETCRCAACVNEFTGERILKPESVPADISLEHLARRDGRAFRPPRGTPPPHKGTTNLYDLRP